MGIEAISNNMVSMQMQAVGKPQSTEAKSNTANAENAAAMNSVTGVVKDNLTITTAKASENNNNNESRQGAPDNETIRKAVEQMRKSMNVNTEAVFGMHEDTKRITIKIVDKESKEVIKEVPAEKTLDMIARVWEMAGILVDEKR